jgi:hypothetical protein
MNPRVQDEVSRFARLLLRALPLSQDIDEACAAAEVAMVMQKGQEAVNILDNGIAGFQEVTDIGLALEVEEQERRRPDSSGSWQYVPIISDMIGQGVGITSTIGDTAKEPKPLQGKGKGRHSRKRSHGWRQRLAKLMAAARQQRFDAPDQPTLVHQGEHHVG